MSIQTYGNSILKAVIIKNFTENESPPNRKLFLPIVKTQKTKSWVWLSDKLILERKLFKSISVIKPLAYSSYFVCCLELFLQNFIVMDGVRVLFLFLVEFN